MKSTRTFFRFFSVFALGWSATAACSDGSGSDDGSADGPDAGAGGSGGSTAPTVTECGGNECSELTQSARDNGLGKCCLPDDTCGTTATWLDDCVPGSLPGALDMACPSLDVDGVMLGGCCTPDAKCGLLEPTLALGCIPAAMLGQPDQDCTGNPGEPTSACDVTVIPECDGPEDCPPGQVCCGQFDNGVYSSYTCSDTCDPGNAEFELCHSDADCSDPAFPCGVTTSEGSMPDFFFRCNDTNAGPSTTTAGPGVECGSGVCGAGEECCIRIPQEAICIPAGSSCECDEPDAG